MNLLMRHPVIAAAVAVLAAFILAPLTPLPAQPPGSTVWSNDGYVEYQVGNAPILLTAGHGGDLMPPAISNRTYGTFAHDTRTLELARELAASIRTRFDLHPHVVLFHLHRRKVDVNRDVVEGAQGHPLGIAAYDAFHQACSTARAAITGSWGAGVYLDLHGHGHPEGWTELGYAITAAELALPNSTLAQPGYIAQSTIRSVGSLPNAYFPEILRGSSSLGGHLQAAGYDSVPGPLFPDPAGGNYFSGGFNVKAYGSRNGGTVDGVQLETPWSVRRTMLVRGPFVNRIGSWVESFLPAYRGFDPAAGERVTIFASDRIASETGGRGEIVIRRTGSLAQTRFVPLVFGGSAQAGADYAPIGPVHVLPPGVAELRLEVRALADGLVEGDETVAAWIANGRDVGVASRAEVVIHDDAPVGDLALHLPFDQVGAGGTTPDVSGNGRDGTVSGGPTLVPGVHGSALRFDGVDDQVRIADFPYAPGGEFALTFWFRCSSTGPTGYRYLVSHGGIARPHRLGVYLEQSTGNLRTALIYQNDLTDLDVLDVTRDLRDGQWHHFALVATGAELVEVHIDGAATTAAQFLGDVLDPAAALALGGRSDMSAPTFAAVDLDEVQLWDRALSDVEVDVLWRGAFAEAMVYPGSTTDLVLATGVDGPATSGPRHDVERAGSGSQVSATFAATDPTLAGQFAVLFADVFVTGAPPVNPLFAELHLGPTPLIVAGPLQLGSVVPSFGFVVPPGFAGLSVMLQPAVLTQLAPNGLFLAGAAHEVRLQ